MLAENALRLVANHPGAFSSSVLMFAGGLAIIVFGYVILGIIASKAETTSPDLSRFIGLLGRSSLFISVPAVALLAYYINPTSAQDVGSESLWVWSHSTVTVQQAFQGAFRLEAIGLFFLILYILFADIVGSPYHLALDDRNYVHSDGFSAAEEKTIQRSFVVNSVSNVIAPIVGTSPVVYYAENFAGKVLGGRTPIVAYVAAIGFALLFAFGARARMVRQEHHPLHAGNIGRSGFVLCRDNDHQQGAMAHPVRIRSR